MAYNSEAVTVYLSATGEVSYLAYRTDGVNPTLVGGEALVDGHWPWADYYIPSGVPTLRPTVLDDDPENAIIDLEVSAGVNQTIIASLPSGTTVDTDGFHGVTSTTEALQIRAERDGTFDIDIEPPFPYKPIALTLVITDVD